MAPASRASSGQKVCLCQETCGLLTASEGKRDVLNKLRTARTARTATYQTKGPPVQQDCRPCLGGGQPKRTVSVLIGPGDGRKPTGKPPPSHWESGKPCAGVAVGCIQLCGLLTVSSNCPLTPRSLLRADDGLELGTLTLWQAWRSGPPGGGFPMRGWPGSTTIMGFVSVHEFLLSNSSSIYTLQTGISRSFKQSPRLRSSLTHAQTPYALTALPAASLLSNQRPQISRPPVSSRRVSAVQTSHDLTASRRALKVHESHQK